MNKKRELIGQKLQQRESQRLADIDKRDSDRRANQVEHEQIEIFVRNMKDEKEDIEKSLLLAESLERQQISDLLDSLSKRCQNLQKYVTESTIFLTAYHMRKYQAVVVALLMAVQETRDALMPTKKFAFKKKKVPKAISMPKSPSEPAEDINKNVVVQRSDAGGFKNLVGQTLTMVGDDITLKDIWLENLKDCKVKLEGSASTIHMTGLVKCTVLVGPVSTSVYVDDCADSHFVVACQQLRIHRTTSSGFYVDVSSRPIIEDCKDVGFAPYNWTYVDIEQHYAQSGLSRDVNNWHDVADFNWLSTEQPSPNWFVISEQHRVRSWF